MLRRVSLTYIINNRIVAQVAVGSHEKAERRSGEERRSQEKGYYLGNPGAVILVGD
jgi:hypothetical protein